MSTDTKAPRYETICGTCNGWHFVGKHYNHNFVARKPDTKPSAGAQYQASNAIGFIRSELKSAIPKLNGSDIEWIVGLIVTERQAAYAAGAAAHVAELVELAEYVISHPHAAFGMGDRPHAERCEMQRMAESALRRFKEGL